MGWIGFLMGEHKIDTESFRIHSKNINILLDLPKLSK